MAMAIPQRTPWYIVPLRFLRAMFQIRRFPGLAMAILVFLLVIRVDSAPRPDQGQPGSTLKTTDVGPRREHHLSAGHG
jgi:hypothetical protein